MQKYSKLNFFNVNCLFERKFEMAKKRVLTLHTVVIPSIGTFGTLVSPYNDELCKTVEREWLDNQPNVSCVPAGTYRLKKVTSPKFGECYCLVNEDLGVSYAGNTTRTHILIHVANYPEELEGCIAPGVSYMKNSWGVSSSKVAFKNLKDLLNQYIAEMKNNVYVRIVRNEQR